MQDPSISISHLQLIRFAWILILSFFFLKIISMSSHPIVTLHDNPTNSSESVSTAWGTYHNQQTWIDLHLR